jgi:hypothetical protein
MASIIIISFLLYVGVGVIFALTFSVFGLGRVDAAAKGASTGFRLIIFPGLVSLWPVFLIRWRSSNKRQGVADAA